MRCFKCGHEWRRCEPFSSLSLQLPAPAPGGRRAPPSLQSLLEEHLAPVSLEVPP